jgi:hypothetical protein
MFPVIKTAAECNMIGATVVHHKTDGLFPLVHVRIFMRFHDRSILGFAENNA